MLSNGDPTLIAAPEDTAAALRESEALLRAIITTAVDGIVTISDRGIVLAFNPAAERMFGYAATEVIGRNVSMIMPEPDRSGHDGYLANYVQTGVKKIIGIGREVLGQRKDGSRFPLDLAVSEIRLRDRRLFTGLLRDITARKRAEEQIREQAALLDKTQDAILVFDLDGRIIYWNKSAQHIYGHPAADSIGRNVAELLHANETGPYQEARRQVLARGEWIGPLRQVSQAGKDITVESRWTLVRDAEGRPHSILVVNTDITARKRLEAQFLRAQRMESIGTLAGGIAHDLNNVLTPILMAMKLLRRNLSEPDRLALLQTLQTSAERGAEMVKQVLSFAGGIEGKRVVLQIKHIVTEVKSMLRHTLPKSINIETKLAENVWPVLGDVTQLSQVLMNLCVNSRDAMPDGGTLTIAAENVLLDENHRHMHLEAKPGPHVLITVADTGCGIPNEIIDKVFDPFFTTKEQGKGTGLGLSTALGIVRSHGGFVHVYSEQGRGTRFSVFLPAIETAQTKQAAQSQDELPMGHGELILVVDDEASIRDITKTTLEAYGYQVVTGNDGTEAVATFAHRAADIKCVLIDMMMPVMDGPATIRVLRKLDPGVRVIATGGLAASTRAAELEGVKTFVQKPYTADKLLITLRQVLDAP